MTVSVSLPWQIGQTISAAAPSLSPSSSAISAGDLSHSGARRRIDQLADEHGEIGQGGHVVDRHVLERAPRHLGHRCLARILDQRQPTPRLDRKQTGGAAVEVPGQDHANDPRTVGDRGGPEERIDRRAKPVLLGPANHLHESRAQQQVVVRRRDVDSARHDRFAMDRQTRGQRPPAGEHLGELALGSGVGVQRREHGGRQLGRQARHEGQQRLRAAFRAAHHDDVAASATSQTVAQPGPFDSRASAANLRSLTVSGSSSSPGSSIGSPRRNESHQGRRYPNGQNRRHGETVGGSHGLAAERLREGHQREPDPRHPQRDHGPSATAAATLEQPGAERQHLQRVKTEEVRNAEVAGCACSSE